MKRYTISFLVVCLCFLSFFVGYQMTNHKDLKLIGAYDNYNKSTEELLDTLNSEYNWVDSFDPQEYYNSREQLDSAIYN